MKNHAKIKYLEAVIEDHIYGVGKGLPPVFMTSDQISDLIDFSLANQMESFSLNWVPVYSQQEPINMEASKFSNPWKESENKEWKKDANVITNIAYLPRSKQDLQILSQACCK